MYTAHPTHGAGTRPNRTQPPTAARKTTLNAGQCVRQPREGRGRNRQAPPPQKKQRGKGGGARNQPTATEPPANTTRGGQTPPPRRHRRQDPQRGTGGPPSQNQQHQARNSGPPGKGTPKRADTHHEEKKKAAAQIVRKVMEGQGPEGLGQGHPAKKKAQKTYPDNPAKKGWAQPRPGSSTHAHTARRNRKRQGASVARTRPHTSHKQAKTEPQPRTPQTADTRGTTPQTVPNHTHPRPQPRLAGYTKPTPNRKPDPNGKRRTTVGNPVPTARALRQPVPCR